jgi:hypothetical protein
VPRFHGGSKVFAARFHERRRGHEEKMLYRGRLLRCLGEFGRKIKEIADEANKRFPYDESKLK